MVEHQIAKSIKRDFERIKSSPEVTAFLGSLDHKSKTGRERDEALFNYLLSKCKMYSEGWILANLNKTTELYTKATIYDREKEKLDTAYEELNNLVNSLIKTMQFNNEQLEQLRDIERKIRKL